MRRSAIWAADIEVAAAAAHADRGPTFRDRLEAAGYARPVTPPAEAVRDYVQGYLVPGRHLGD